MNHGAGLDAQNFGSICTTAIRAPETWLEDITAFGGILRKRDKRRRPRMVVVTEQYQRAL